MKILTGQGLLSILTAIGMCSFSGDVFCAPRASVETAAGAVVNHIELDIGEVFEGRRFHQRYELEYWIQSQEIDRSIVIESPSCRVGKVNLVQLALKFDGKSMISIRDLQTTRFSINVDVVFPEQIEGEVSCESGEIRELESGNVLATISLRGFVHRIPRWAGVLGERLRDVWFSFDGLVARDRPALDVISSNQYIRLSYAKTYPAVARFFSPSRCSIGTTMILDETVRLRVNNSDVEDGDFVMITNDSLQALALKFLSSAGVGDKAGVVRCVNKGALIYSY